MKKIVIIILIIATVISMSTVYAFKAEEPKCELLITNYKLVDTVVFTRVHGNGKMETYEYTQEDIISSEKTKLPYQRIIDRSIDFYSDDQRPQTQPDGIMYITINTKDGDEIISEDINIYFFTTYKNYVYNARRGEVIDKKIYSKIPDGFEMTIVGVYVFLAGILIFFVKIILGAILKVKPLGQIAASAVLSNILLIILTILAYRFIPINVFILLCIIVVVVAYFEYWYINKSCTETLPKKRIIYIIAANSLEIVSILFVMISLS